MLRAPLISLCVLSVSACGEPEAIIPVDLQPGRYEIELDGQGTKSLCFLPDRVTSFAESPLLGIMDIPTDGCTVEKSREGNAFRGSMTCSSAGAEFGSQGVKLSYEGSLTAQSFEVHGTLDVNTPQGGGQRSVRAVGTRSGDC